MIIINGSLFLVLSLNLVLGVGDVMVLPISGI